MQHATFEQFSAAHDALKARVRCTLTNLFQDGHELRVLLAEKKCLLHTAEKSLFLLVPYHDAYYDLLYLAADAPTLEDGLRELLKAYTEPLALRGSCIGREPQAGDMAEIFRSQGFALTKKLLRMRATPPPQKILDAMRPYAEEYRDCMSFAGPEDAEEIFALLKEEFDIVADNLPELESIRQNILKKGVAVLRWENTIASLMYFQKHKNTIHGLYDVTRRQYRRQGFFMALVIFLKDHDEPRQKLRVYGWRDAARQKLVKYAKENNQLPDGIVIYNMLWTPPHA